MDFWIQATYCAISHFHQNKMTFEVRRKQMNFVAMDIIWRKLGVFNVRQAEWGMEFAGVCISVSELP